MCDSPISAPLPRPSAYLYECLRQLTVPDGSARVESKDNPMDSIPLPFYEAASLDNICHGLKGVRILFVNVFAVSSGDGGWTLIDAGLYLSAGKIKHWAEGHFGKGTKPQAI